MDISRGLTLMGRTVQIAVVALSLLGAVAWFTAGAAEAGLQGNVRGEAGEAGEAPMTAKTVKEVLQSHAAALLAIPGVVGVAEGRCDGSPCLKVFVAARTPELEEQIPRRLEGYPVVVEETGEIRALPQKRHDREDH